MVDRKSLASLDHKYTPPEDVYDDSGWSWVRLVSSVRRQKATKVGISYVMLRTYFLIYYIGWRVITKGGEEVATP